MRTTTPCALILSLLTLTAVATSDTNDSGGVLIPEQAAYDVEVYRLDLKVDPERKRIHGTLTMGARLLAPSAEIAMDLDQLLKIEELEVTTTVDGKARKLQPRYRHEQGRIWIPLADVPAGAQLDVAVTYGGEPREASRPPWDGGFTWASTASGQPWIATSCQGEGADLWWPCKDHPSDEPESISLHITVPEPLVVATNGAPMGVRSEEKGWHTWDWKVSTPINNYGVALNIAPYETVTTEFESVAGDTFDFTYWVLPENLEKGKKVFEEFQRQMRFFEEVCGPYPFRADKYGVAETPHLGMEHQTIIAYGHRYRGDPDLGYDYDWLHHHELSHEWWGNLVTALDWNDFWIHEGVGTYMQALYLERRFGEEAYRRKLASDLRRVMNRGSVAPRDPRSTSQMYFSPKSLDAPDGDVYFKGSWICHSLRWLVGDEAFFTIVRRWAYPDPASETTHDGSACRFATTDELLAIAEEHSGRELDWFFDLYLRQPKVPRLEARLEGEVLHLSWVTPGELPFPMPVEVEVDGERVRVPMPEGSGSLEVGDAEWKLDPLRNALMERKRKRRGR